MKKLWLAILPMMLLVACKSNDDGGTQQASSPTRTIQVPDGKTYNLSNSPKGWVTADTNFGKFTGYNQNSSYYGAWVDDSRQVRELTYQGTPATNIPQSGRATYLGNVVRVEDGSITDVGKSRLEVSFGEKTVQGSLTLDGLRRDVTLHKTDLNGAKFEGQASVLLNDGGMYRGVLMGDKATEVAGLVEFKNNPDLNSAFGGQRY